MVITTIELYMCAELVFYVLNDGEQRLYEAVAEQASRFRDWLSYRASVADTLRMIRRLPES